jgi:hypothetical protein
MVSSNLVENSILGAKFFFSFSRNSISKLLAPTDGHLSDSTNPIVVDPNAGHSRSLAPTDSANATIDSQCTQQQYK